MAKKQSIQSEPLTAAKKPASKAAPKAAVAKKPAKAAAAPRTQVKETAITKPGTSKAKITSADIALRAYFIGEKRHKLGLPGDSTHDWVEAERQLKAEASSKPIL